MTLITPLTALEPHSVAAGAADHLDALDVLEHDVLREPQDPRIERRVEDPPVQQHEQLVIGAVHAARADGVRVRGGARDLEVGREAQRFRKGARTRAPDIVRADDVDRRGGIRHLLCVSGYGGDLEVGELLERQGGELGHRMYSASAHDTGDGRRKPNASSEQPRR